MGVRLAGGLTSQMTVPRLSPPDFMEIICQAAIRSNWRIYFLGAKPGVAQLAADRLIRKYPELQIKTHHGYFDMSNNSSENNNVVQEINIFTPELLVVGFGMPLQERWILENINSLNVKIAFPAGALFDYLSGQLPRAPRWVTDNGFEWLGRLIIEPRRLWKRYVIGIPLFFWRVFIHHYLGYPLPK